MTASHHGGLLGKLVVGVVPARNEEATIGPTVEALREVAGVSEVVVVADGCTDGTASVARAAGAQVVESPGRLGKGGAVESVLNRVASADVVVLIDGDVGVTASEAATLLGLVLGGQTDVAIGALPRLGGGGFGAVKRVARAAIRALGGGFEAMEPLSGQRALTAEALQACRPLARGFGLEVGMTIDALRLGYRVMEVPVDMRHRPTGRSVQGFLHRGRQGRDIVAAVVTRAFRLR